MDSFCYIFDTSSKSALQVDPIPDSSRGLSVQRFAWIDFNALDATLLLPWLQAANMSEVEIKEWNRQKETIFYSHRQKVLLQWIPCCRLEQSQIVQTPLLIIMTDRFIVTAHDGPFQPVQQTRMLCEESFRSVGKTPGFIFFLLWDHIIDMFLPLFAALDEHLDELEESYLMGRCDRPVFESIIHAKRMIRQVKQNLLPLQRMLRHLVSTKLDLVSEESLKYLHGLYDGMDRLSGMLDVLQERSHATFEGYNSLLSQQTNNSVRILTIITTVLMPLSLIAAIYGTNFTYVPEFTWRYAYFGFWGILVIMAGVMLYFLWRKKWI